MNDLPPGARTDPEDAFTPPVAEPTPTPRRVRLIRRLSPLRRLRVPRRRPVRWPRLMFAAATLSLASLGVMIALLNSALLDIKAIEVEGAEVVSAASVKQLIGLKGQHVMLADLEAAQQRVVSLPMVKDVTVSRDWPNGVKVVIVERKPWGRWRADNIVWAIDSEGVILDGAAPLLDGPLVTQISAWPAIKAGAVVDRAAVDLVADLHQRGAPVPLPSILAYEWSLADGLVVLTEHGRIVFGDAEGFDYKYAVGESLEREALRRGEPLMFADLRFGLRPRVEIGLNVGRGIRFQDHTTASLPR